MSRADRPESLPIRYGSLAVQLRPQRFASLTLYFDDPSFSARGADLWLRPGGELSIVGRSWRLPTWLDASIEEAYREPLATLAKRIEAFAGAFDRASESGGIGLPFVSISATEFSRGVMAGVRFGNVGAGSASYQLLESGALKLNTPSPIAEAGVAPLHPSTRRSIERNAESFGPAAIERIERLLRPMAQREMTAFRASLTRLPRVLEVLRP